MYKCISVVLLWYCLNVLFLALMLDQVHHRGTVEQTSPPPQTFFTHKVSYFVEILIWSAALYGYWRKWRRHHWGSAPVCPTKFRQWESQAVLPTIHLENLHSIAMIYYKTKTDFSRSAVLRFSKTTSKPLHSADFVKGEKGIIILTYSRRGLRKL